MDTDAFDPESFRWRQLSVEGVLHDLVVPHVPTLGFTHIKTCSIISNYAFFPPCAHLRWSLHSLKLGAPAFVRPPLAEVLQTVLMYESKIFE